MTHALLAAKSGWGKSWFAQLYIEHNIENVDYALVLDYCDEYQGIADAGMAKWMGVGDQEADVSTAGWRGLLEDNEKLILARKGLLQEEWREVCANAIKAARDLADADSETTVLIVIDESHFVAQQQGAYPDVIKGVSTTGRGEGVSSIWVTQRPAELDKTIIGNMMMFILGGFGYEGDRNQIEGYIGYNVDAHDPSLSHVSGLPEALHVDGKPIPLRKFTEGEGDDEHLVGSEFIRSDDAGNFERVDTREKSMQTTHHGNEGHNIENP